MRFPIADKIGMAIMPAKQFPAPCPPVKLMSAARARRTRTEVRVTKLITICVLSRVGLQQHPGRMLLEANPEGLASNYAIL